MVRVTYTCPRCRKIMSDESGNNWNIGEPFVKCEHFGVLVGTGE